MKTARTKPPKSASASALIIAVILTSLLAIIGMMFVMIARVDKMATSAISQNKDLDSAVEAVVAVVSQELILDVPGVPGQEYYDYPDANNDAWLASLEPYQSGSDYYWRRISDIYSRLDANDLLAEIIVEDQPSITEDVNADADGDGVADSKWVKLDDMTSGKGKPIYAAVRIIDNGAMLNVNTAYKFDPTATTQSLIDGSSQLQINLMALASQPGEIPPTSGKETDLLEARANYGVGVDPLNLEEYEKNVVWRYNEPNGVYTPFDISDELELRYRFLVNQSDIDTRLEVLGNPTRAWGFREYAFTTPADKAGDLPEWFISACDNGGILDPNYAYRHIGTIYNMDRIITPDCSKMTNINTADADALYRGIRRGLLDANYPAVLDVNGVASQIAVNLIDFRDDDSDVNVFSNIDVGETYFGFERPCIYISELAHRFVLKPTAGTPPVFPGDYDTSYAIELYKPYADDNDPCEWQLVVSGSVGGTFPINNWKANEQYYVIQNQNINAQIDVNLGAGTAVQNTSLAFALDGEIQLQRPLPDGSYITVDSKVVPNTSSGGWWSLDDNLAHSIQRDITLHKCIRRLWDSAASDPCLGKSNSFVDSDAGVIQAHPENKLFTNVGEIGMVLRKSAYSDGPYPMGTGEVEADARINLADPNFQQIFKYLTVFDPNSDGINNDGDGKTDLDPVGWVDEVEPDRTPEWKVPGRININTAPWFVLAQLPWVSQRGMVNGVNYDDASLARAIVAYRDKVDLSPSGPDYYRGGANDSRFQETGIPGLREEPGFASIGELTTVINNSLGKENYSMNYYTLGSENGIDLTGFPDLTTPDGPSLGVLDDFEERDVIFARISNLVTVRSDVFTVYILVRLGPDGPQKRVMAILDRSDIIPNPDYDPITNPHVIPYLGKFRIIAIHPVPDPR
ncbi:MAG: hypothetical protein WC454_03790 [Phycisphaerae bacterium]|jgi:hypothetical protein